MKVIGAGFGRTGTSSMRAALEQLGLGPCHHMDALFEHPEQIPLWLEVAEGGTRNWDTVLAGYPSAVDFPAQHWYKELMAAYPNAKVILTIRDPERWYDSVRQTIYAISEDIPMRWVGQWIPVVGGVFRLSRTVIWQGDLQGRFLDRDFAISWFKQYNNSVIEHVPPEKLLVFNVQEGWEPLCRFLELPVPATPFPHHNDSAEFGRRVRRMKLGIWLSLLLPPLLLALVLGGWLWT
jgi:hypothetical protein